MSAPKRGIPDSMRIISSACQPQAPPPACLDAAINLSATAPSDGVGTNKSKPMAWLRGWFTQ